MKTEKCKPVKHNETISHDLIAAVVCTHTQDKKEKKTKTNQRTTTVFHFPFQSFSSWS